MGHVLSQSFHTLPSVLLLPQTVVQPCLLSLYSFLKSRSFYLFTKLQPQCSISFEFPGAHYNTIHSNENAAGEMSLLSYCLSLLQNTSLALFHLQSEIQLFKTASQLPSQVSFLAYLE